MVGESDGAPIRVLIADDEGLIRAGLRTLVDSAPDLLVVGEASTGVQAVRVARKERADVVLMDIRMPVMDGLDATRHLVRGDPDSHVRVLVVTTFDDDDYVLTALRHGASGFILKDTPPADILAAIRIVAQGEALLAPVLTRRLIAHYVRRSPVTGRADDRMERLTDRERAVWEQVALGRSNGEIAETLVIAVATVKTHVGRLLSKLEVRDRVQLVVLAYEAGVVVPGTEVP